MVNQIKDRCAFSDLSLFDLISLLLCFSRLSSLLNTDSASATTAASDPARLSPDVGLAPQHSGNGKREEYGKETYRGPRGHCLAHRGE